MKKGFPDQPEPTGEGPREYGSTRLFPSPQKIKLMSR